MTADVWTDMWLNLCDCAFMTTVVLLQDLDAENVSDPCNNLLAPLLQPKTRVTPPVSPASGMVKHAAHGVHCCITSAGHRNNTVCTMLAVT